MDANGRAIVTGGDDEQKTSYYVPSSNSWTSAANMRIARGYQSSATCSNGKIFTIGGSWSGPLGGKNGEIYDPVANTWTLLNGCVVAPMLTNDAQGIFRQDNHAWVGQNSVVYYLIIPPRELGVGKLRGAFVYFHL